MVALLIILGLVMAGAVGALTWMMRGKLRAQLLERDAHMLHAVASAKFQRSSEVYLNVLEDDALLTAALDATDLRGIISLQIYDPNGFFITSVPETWTTEYLSERTVIDLSTGEPVARYLNRPELAPESIRNQASGNEPVVEVLAPLTAKDGFDVRGIVRYWLDGREMKEAFAALDRNLRGQSVLAWLLVYVPLALVIGLSFRQLQKKNAKLAERSQRLLRMNSDLAATTKTSAVGELYLHLIHGLKNHLLSLRGFVEQSRNGPVDEASSTAAEAALDDAGRMVNEVVEIVRDTEALHQYSLTVDEWSGFLCERIRPLATNRNLKFECHCSGNEEIESSRANLATLIIENLAHNAVLAAPEHSKLTLSINGHGDHVKVTLADQGPGLPEDVKAQLFQPLERNQIKTNGNGIGLFITSMLARRMNADLNLEESGENGSRFSLTIPLLHQKTAQ